MTCFDRNQRARFPRRDDAGVGTGKVFPTEIEDVVALHPGVKESAAIGVPDERTGEAVKLLVVRKDPAVDVATLAAHCRAHLTPYKCPKHIEFTTDLPKTAIGKVLRRQLRDALVARAPGELARA